MTKKTLFAIILVIALSVVTCAFVACNSIDDDSSTGSADSSTVCEHVYGEWETVTAATCQTEGEEKATCAKCGDEKTRVIAKVAHDYGDSVKTIVLSADGESATQNASCKNCSNEQKTPYSGDYVSKDIAYRFVSGKRQAVSADFFVFNGNTYYAVNNVIVKNYYIINDTVYDFGTDGVKKDVTINNEFVEVGGNTYYVINNIIVKNYYIINGTVYDFGDDGIKKDVRIDKTFIEVGGNTYYVINNIIVKNYYIINGTVYDFGTDGIKKNDKISGLLEIGDKTYYVEDDNKVAVGNRVIGDQMYRFGEDGAKEDVTINNEFVTVGGNTYYVINNIIVKNYYIIDDVAYDFGDDGIKKNITINNEFVTVGSNTYYVINNIIVKNYYIIDGTVYDFGTDGIKKDVRIDKTFIEIGGNTYYVINNIIVKNYYIIDDVAYDFGDDGIKKNITINNKFVTVGSNTYYVINNVIVKNYYIINGTVYDFGTDGVKKSDKISGLLEIGGKTYYVEGDNKIAVGNRVIGDTMYSFGTDGVKEDVTINNKFVTVGSNTYYVINNIIVKNYYIINGTVYDFGTDGVKKSDKISGLLEIGGKTYYVSDNNKITVNTYIYCNYRIYRFGEDGAMLVDSTFEGYYFGLDGALTVTEKTYVKIDGTYYEIEGNKSSYHYHENSSDWIIDKAATCTVSGSKHKECTVCHTKLESATIPSLGGHTPSDWIIDKNVTCTEAGSKHKECTVCHTKLESATISAIGHNYGVWTVTKAATCTVEGERTSYCSRCDCTITSKIPVLGHNVIEKSRKEATCSNAGYIEYGCTRCTYTYKVTIYASHEYEVSDRKAATCTQDGYIQYTCVTCSDSYKETIPHGNHDYELTAEQAATKQAAGYKEYTCKNCSDVYRTEIPKLKDGVTGKVLLIEDRLPWTERANAAVLNALVSGGYISGWNVITASQIATHEFEDYDLILIANDQTTSSYNTIKANAEKIADFAYNGGSVIYGSCDNGWACGEITYKLPGGVGKTNYYSNYNYIVDNKSPIVTAELTDGSGLTNALLYGTYCSHTTFTSLPQNANVILIDGKGNPSLVEYDYGNGYVLLSGLTWEYSYVRNLVASGSYAKSVFDDMIVYALSKTGAKCEHIYDSGDVFAPTCTNIGYTLYTCAVCGRVVKKDIVSPLGHDYGEWVVDEDATCTASGSKHKTCTRSGCKDTVTESIAIIAHISSDWIIDKAATCTEAGSKHKECTVCHTKLERASISSLGGHTYSSWVVDKAATCTAAGSKHKTCTRSGCGYTVTESIAKIAHTPSEWITDYEATCENAGAKHKECTVCYTTLESATISPLGHNYVNGACTRCGAKDPAPISDGAYTRVDASGAESATGKYILFGSYPQTKVTDNSVISALNNQTGELPTSDNNQTWTNYEYYISGDNTTAYMWYKDVTYNNAKYRGVYFTQYRPYNCSISSSSSNSNQYTNKYYTSTVYWFKYEPVKWRILDEKDGKAFLLCEIAIDSQQYYHTSSSRTLNGKTVYANNYAESEIRAWLNQTFYNTAFNTLQQSLIQTTVVDNSVSSTGYSTNTYACETTNDKIFLLSYTEVTNSAYGFSNDSERQKKSSDYAKSQGCWQSPSGGYAGNCFWWLRSPYCLDSSYVRYVSYDGYVYYKSYVFITSNGVVPALWLDLNAGDSDAYTRVDENGAESATGKYILFGSYPQTKVSDSSITSSLTSQAGTLPTSSNYYGWTNYEYYISGDNTTAYMWYKDVTYNNAKYRGVYFTSFRPYRCDYSSSSSNSNQYTNKYYTSTVYWFKYEPIKWRILEEKDGKSFLLCEIAIDSQQYYHTASGATRTIGGKTVYENNYAESEIRAWLNQTFYNTAFNSLQQSLIQTTVVDNSVSSTGYSTNTYACENTNDKIFLLSYKEVTNSAYGFSTNSSIYDSARQKKSSDYAKSQGCWQSTSSSYAGNCWWRLRSPFYTDSYSVRGVYYDGRVTDSDHVTYSESGVVPALWLAL